MSMLEQPSDNHEARPVSPVIDMRDIPLGTLVHRAGLLTAEQLEGALAEGSASGKRLGEVLIDRGLLAERQVAELIAGQKGMPFVEIRPESVDPEAAALLPQIAARQFGALAIALEDGIPVIAIADPADQDVIDFLGERIEGEYRLVVAPRTEIEGAALSVSSSNGRAAPAPVREVAEAPAPPDPTVPAPPDPTVRAAPEATVPAAPDAAAPAVPDATVPAAAEAAAPAPAAPRPPVPQPTPAAFRLVLRLLNGELLELGSFDDRGSADESASHVVQQLIAGEAAGWLAFDGRYVRPGAIVSLDVI
jgi:Type II secretion system (T2SS), protein E, N-terminal domain